MTAINSLAVFCGSRVGKNPAYAEAGREFFLGCPNRGSTVLNFSGKPAT